MSRKLSLKENPELKETVEQLLKISRDNNSIFWRDIALRLMKPKKSYPRTNVGSIEAKASDGEVLVVPGYVLGTGYINRKVTVSALKASPKAIEKMKNGGSSFVALVDLAKDNPKGTNIRILR
jgi:large subunit ribosomal protein L18e